MLPASATRPGQAQLFLQVLPLRPPGAAFGMGATARLWDGTPCYVLLDGGAGRIPLPVPPPALCPVPTLES